MKLNLITSESHSRVAQLLSESHMAKYEQENFFFDGQNKELSSQLAVLRVRIYNSDEKAELTLKVSGIHRGCSVFTVPAFAHSQLLVCQSDIPLEGQFMLCSYLVGILDRQENGTFRIYFY